MIKTTIIIPCLNEKKYIATCIESILSSEIDFESCEIILVDGGSSDATVEIIQKYQEKYGFIKLLHNPKKITPISMNIAIKEAKGDYIIRLDAHAKYPKDYIKKLLYYHQQLNASNVGGVWITDVKNKNKKSNAIKKVLSHPFGVGNGAFRIGVMKIQEVDTVPFGCYKKELLLKLGLYDERLIRNQDIELNKRIKKNGGKIYLVPDITCTYYARENFIDLAKNNFANGKWNILTAYYTKKINSLSLRHFVPLIFVLMLLLPALLSLFYSSFIYIFLFMLISYLSLVIIISLKLKKKSNGFAYLLGSFFTLHFSYGLGSLSGIFSIIIKYIKGDR